MTEAVVKEKKVKEPKVKVEKIIQNGIVRPKAGSQTGKVWMIAEELSNAAGAPVARSIVLAACEAEGINPATVATQYGKWRVFHNLAPVVRVKKEKVAKVAEVEEEADCE